MASRRKGKASVTTTVPSYVPDPEQHRQQPAPIAPSSSPSSPSSLSSPDPTHVRHYPLDLPSGLPFERYEHRRISTRDILVHRILSRILFPPTRELAQSLDQHRQAAYQGGESSRPKYHNFGPIKQHDPALARDIEVLRKTLTGTLPSEWAEDLRLPLWRRHHMSSPHTHDLSKLSVQDEVLDLIRIYFLETDDAAMRLWLKTFKLPHRASYDTLPKLPGKKDSRKSALQGRRDWHERHAKHQHKRWYHDDQVHLKTASQQLGFSGRNLPRLYDGGAFLPRLRQPLLETKALRLRYMGRLAAVKEVPLDHGTFLGKRIQFPWPEPRHVPKRYLHVPSLNYMSLSHYWHDPPAVNLSAARTGRGLDRDGIWSTHRWSGDDGERGRTRQRQRRRGTSEPPPGLFMMARLPASYGFSSEMIISPKMSLVTLERRVRSRSLSRTRIAEMFNWDVVMEGACIDAPEPPPQSTEPQSSGATSATDPKPRITLQILDYLLEDFEHTFRPIDRAYRERLRHVWVTQYLGELDGQDKWRHCWAEMLDDGDIALFFLVDMHFQMMHKLAGEMEEVAQTKEPPPSPVIQAPCENCKATCHTVRSCLKPCGYCGAANPSPSLGGRKTVYDSSDAGNSGNPHIAPQCPVAQQNRCKCVPFPQYHVAAKCTVLCSRDCGNAFSPGHFKHKSAMTCSARCCMCGMRGHSGAKCKLKRCRCGGSHLGQDCRFHPECRVPGCDRFLCGFHCQACGRNRAQFEEGVVFVDQKCPACCDAQPEATHHGQEDDSEKKKRRRNRRKHRRVGPKPEEEARPWYAPLEPRTRPIVLSKSGKRTNARYHQDGSAFVGTLGQKG